MTGNGFEFFPESHTYLYNGKRMTGCTTVLSIISKSNLIPWAARMAVEHIADNIAALIGADQETTERILTEAKNAHLRKKEAGAQKGTDTHALVEQLVKNSITANGGFIPHDWARDEKIGAFVDWAWKEKIRFLSSEARFYSEKLYVAGTADLVFEKDGKRFVGDVKTYGKLWDRVPHFQAAGYCLMAEEMGEPAFDGTCIINLPKERPFNELEDVSWSYDIEDDKKSFMAAVTLYRALNRDY